MMPGFDLVPFDDLVALEKKLASNPSEYCAFMVEPIQVSRAQKPPCIQRFAPSVSRFQEWKSASMVYSVMEVRLRILTDASGGALLCRERPVLWSRVTDI